MPREDGTSARQHLVKAWHSTRKMPKALAAAEVPEWGRYLLGMFHDLASGRMSSGFGPMGIGWAEMEAWSRLRRRPLAAWEVDILRRLDDAWLRAWSENG